MILAAAHQRIQNAVLIGCLIVVSGTADATELLRLKPATETIRLGQDREVLFRARIPIGVNRVQVLAARGEIADMEVTEKGVVTVRYVPPEQFFPAVDAVVLLAEEGERLHVGVARIRLIGQGRARIVTSPDAVTHLRIGNRRFGPVKADSTGLAFVDIEVPPGISAGLDDQGNAVDLGLPEMPRAMLVLWSGDRISTESSQAIPLIVVTHAPDGRVDRDAVLPMLSVTEGEVSDLRLLSDGVYYGIYQVAAGSAGEAVFTLRYTPDAPAYEKRIALMSEIDVADDSLRISLLEEDTSELDGAGLSNERDDRRRLVFVGGAGGLATGFRGWLSGVGRLELGVRLPVDRLETGLGIRIGFQRSSHQKTNEESRADGSDVQVTVRSAVWPLTMMFWHRYAVLPKLNLFSAAHIGTALVQNRILSSGDDAYRAEILERRWVFSAGIGLAVEFSIWRGVLFAGLDGMLYLFEMQSLQGNLLALECLAGYRFFFR